MSEKRKSTLTIEAAPCYTFKYIRKQGKKWEVLLILEINQCESKIKTKSENKTKTSYYTAVEHSEQSSLSATVSWLKSIRLAKLLEQMRSIDFRKENALEELKELTRSVDELISSNRGGTTGIHGFIGERAHVYLSNAWSIIKGEAKICELIDDNGMTDYFEKGIPIQQKACRANGWLGLDHVLRHKEKYDGFSGIYHIPKDFYEVYSRLEKMSQQEAGRLRRHEWNLWCEIQKVKKAGITVKPMKVTYSEIQRDNIYDTIENNKKELQSEAERQAELATEAQKPTVKACIKTVAVSSVVEGVLLGSVKVLEKSFDGKHVKDYDKQDIKDIGLATAEGSVKGAVRGAAVYLAENCTLVPGIVAGASVTVVFESGKAIKKYSDGELTKQDCAYYIGKSVITASAGAFGAKIGGKICPIPVVGETIGGFLAAFLADKGFSLIVKHTATTLEKVVSNPIKSKEVDYGKLKDSSQYSYS